MSAIASKVLEFPNLTPTNHWIYRHTSTYLNKRSKGIPFVSLNPTTTMVLTATLRRAAVCGSLRAQPLGMSRLNTARSLLSTLAILEQKNGQLNLGSLSAITAAKQLGGSIHGFVAGSNAKGAAGEVAKVDGLEKVVAVENAAYDKASSKL